MNLFKNHIIFDFEQTMSALGRVLALSMHGGLAWSYARAEYLFWPGAHEMGRECVVEMARWDSPPSDYVVFVSSVIGYYILFCFVQFESCRIRFVAWVALIGPPASCYGRCGRSYGGAARTIRLVSRCFPFESASSCGCARVPGQKVRTPMAYLYIL